MAKSKIEKVVLAYSGGLDTSVMVRWIKEAYHCEIICFCADVGQGPELEGLKQKALDSGASRLIVRDLRREFVTDFVWTAVKANAVYEGSYLLGTSLARPVIAKHQVDIAREFGADAVAHGATGKGNDQVRFELTYYALEPKIKVVAPWREWEFGGRTELIEYATKYKIPIKVTAQRPYSSDRNLMHISYEGGILEDPWAEPPEDIFELTKSPEQANNHPQVVTLQFEKGCLIGIDGQKSDPVTLLEKLNAMGGDHGIGRVDIVENRFVGMKSRGVYETPGVTILLAAHRALESIVLDREVLHFKEQLALKMADIIYNGFWYSPEGQTIRNVIDSTQTEVNGEIRVKLYRGNVQILGRRSPNSRYRQQLASFETDHDYNQRDAEGFIRLNALRLRLSPKA